MSCIGGVNGNQPSERRHPCKSLSVVLKPGSVRVNTETPAQGRPHISLPICVWGRGSSAAFGYAIVLGAATVSTGFKRSLLPRARRLRLRHRRGRRRCAGVRRRNGRPGASSAWLSTDEHAAAS